MGRAVVIDGPAGSGKSTTAIELASKLGFIYLDTGAMYRALTIKFMQSGISSFDNEETVNSLLDSTKIEIRPAENGLQIFLDNIDVTEKIRSNEVEAFVSDVSAVPAVREFLHKLQRKFSGQFDIVAEGRDLGTVVFPDADVKIFLVADLEERAKRRLLQKKAAAEKLSDLRNNLKKRDHIDSNRQHSPLKKADDAIEIDTTNLKFEQQVSVILDLCRQKLK